MVDERSDTKLEGDSGGGEARFGLIWQSGEVARVLRSQRSLLLGPASLCLRLLLLLGYLCHYPSLLRGLVQRWCYGKVCLRSLLSNSFGGSDAAIYWLVWGGVHGASLCVLPLTIQTYWVPRLDWHFFYCHWNLVLIVFHYYQAISASPALHPTSPLQEAYAASKTYQQTLALSVLTVACCSQSRRDQHQKAHQQ